MRCIKRLGIVLSYVFLLAGCATDIKPIPAPTPLATGIAIGAIGGGILGSASVIGAPLGAWFGGLAGAVYSHNYSKQITLLKKIEDNGIQVIIIGDELKLVLPADKFFTVGAPTFSTYSLRILDMIVEFLRLDPKISVKVSGFTDNQGTAVRNLALSKSWAELTAQYLWNHDLDARLLYAEGYGDCQTVASNKTLSGRAANRRVEISLYRITDTKITNY